MNEHHKARVDEIKQRIRDGHVSVEDTQWLVVLVEQQDELLRSVGLHGTLDVP